MDAEPFMSMNTTLVINAKGGVGKTTITTNLASYFASRATSPRAPCRPPSPTSTRRVRA